LLLLLLLAPALAGKKFLPPREEIYSSLWWKGGAFPYMEGQIFREKNDLDVVFMGASHTWGGIDTPYVQQLLSEQLGRPAIARTFCWGGTGDDILYLVARDLLENRRVRMLVVDDDDQESDRPHLLAPRLFRFGDDAAALDGLPVSCRAMYYFAAVEGMPHNWLSLLRTNLPADMSAPSYWQIHSHAPNVADNLGAVTAQIGFRSNPDAEPEPFSAYTPQTGVRPSDVCIYSADTKTHFSFSSSSLPPMQLHFAQKLSLLAREHGCKLVVLHIPIFDERRSAVIFEPALWPDALQNQVTVMGIPPATLFRGLTDGEIRKLYSDPLHFNENGQKYFTSLITPNLLKIYESPIQNP
jgi:hypothetical protein